MSTKMIHMEVANNTACAPRMPAHAHAIYCSVDRQEHILGLYAERAMTKARGADAVVSVIGCGQHKRHAEARLQRQSGDPNTESLLENKE